MRANVSIRSTRVSGEEAESPGGRYAAGVDSIPIRSNRGTSIHDKELQFAVHTIDKPVAAGSVDQSRRTLMGVGQV